MLSNNSIKSNYNKFSATFTIFYIEIPFIIIFLTKAIPKL